MSFTIEKVTRCLRRKNNWYFLCDFSLCRSLQRTIVSVVSARPLFRTTWQYLKNNIASQSTETHTLHEKIIILYENPWVMPSYCPSRTWQPTHLKKERSSIQSQLNCYKGLKGLYLQGWDSDQKQEFQDKVDWEAKVEQVEQQAYLQFIKLERAQDYSFMSAGLI